VNVAVVSTRNPVQRAALSLALFALATLVFMDETDVRRSEAVIARGLVEMVTQGRSVASGTIVYFGVGSPEVVGMDITALCSTAVLMIPLLALAAIIAMVTRAKTARIGLGLSVSLALVLLCNLARYVSAAWAYTTYGVEGFDLVHRYLGSLFVIGGFVVAIALLLRLSLRERHARGAGAVAAPPSPVILIPPHERLRRDLRPRTRPAARHARRKDRK